MASEKAKEMTGEREINASEYVTKRNYHRTMHPSMDTNGSTSSRYSVDSQKQRIGPPPGTYVIKIPKEEIYRVPPPENAGRYEKLSRQNPNRSSCRRCFCYSLAVVLALLLFAAIVFGILYLVYRPNKPLFSVSKVSVTGINLTSASPISPVIKINVRSQNINAKLDLIYGKGNTAEIFYGGIKLGNGVFTAFKQPPNNVTVILTALKGLRIQLTSASRKQLTGLQRKGKVPFDLRIRAPVKFKVGVVTTGTVTVTVDCKVLVDKLTASATVVKESCDTSLGVLRNFI